MAALSPLLLRSCSGGCSITCPATEELPYWLLCHLSSLSLPLRRCSGGCSITRPATEEQPSWLLCHLSSPPLPLSSCSITCPATQEQPSWLLCHLSSPLLPLRGCSNMATLSSTAHPCSTIFRVAPPSNIKLFFQKVKLYVSIAHVKRTYKSQDLIPADC